MKESKYRGVYTDGRNYYTRSNSGKSIYGEKVIKISDKYYHLWNPFRSKLAATMKLNIKTFPFKNSKVLYLGASTGTTVSHLADVSKLIWAVEISPISMKSLLNLAEEKDNIIPILDDARNVRNLSLFVRKPDIIYQDVSQRDQVSIFVNNMEYFSPHYGFLMLKTRTIDMRKKPKSILQNTISKLKENGYKIIEVLNISKFQKDHFAIVVKK